MVLKTTKMPLQITIAMEEYPHIPLGPFWPQAKPSQVSILALWRPLLPYGYSYQASDRVKPSFVVFDIRALWRSRLSVRVPRCQKLQMTA